MLSDTCREKNELAMRLPGDILRVTARFILLMGMQ